MISIPIITWENSVCTLDYFTIDANFCPYRNRLKKSCQSICSGMIFLCFVCFEWSFARIGIHFRKLPVKQIFKPQFHIRLRTAVWINVPILVLSPYPSNCASTMAMAVLLSVPTR